MTIRKKLNTGNSFHLQQSQSGCCPDDGTVCRYDYTFDDDATTLTSIVIDGTTVALGAIDPTGELLDLITALETKFEAAGYPGDGYVSITAWRGDDSLTINILSAVVLGDLVTSAGTVTVSVNCIAAPLCYWEIDVDVADDVDFNIEFGKGADLVGGNIAGDYSTGNADALDDDIITLFDGAEFEGTLLQITRVEAVEDLGEAKYKVGIWGYRPNGGNMYLDGELLEPKTCKPDYSKE